MTLKLHACILGSETNPSGLSNGHLLQFCSTLSGLAALANQESEFESKLICMTASLRAQYGDANVVLATAPLDPVYKWVWDGNEWTRICVVSSSLRVSKELADGSTLVIVLEVEGSMPYVP